MTTLLPDKYADPECETAHRSTFAPPTKCPVKPVFPPGVREEDFASAIQDFISAVGDKAVFVNEALSDYIDPYDVWEADEGKRKMPSAAVWSVVPAHLRLLPAPPLLTYDEIVLPRPMNSEKSYGSLTNTRFPYGPSLEGKILG
jgi:hypothetical protein